MLLAEMKIQSAMGSMNEDIDISKEGRDIMIGFNPKFILDALRVIDDEEIIEKMCRTDMVKYIDYQK